MEVVRLLLERGANVQVIGKVSNRTCVSVCLYVYLSVSPYVCLCLYLSVCLTIYILVCVAYVFVCVCLCSYYMCEQVCTCIWFHHFIIPLFRFFSSLYYHYDNCCICVSVYLCVFLCVYVVCNLFSVLTLCTLNYYCSYDIMFMCVFMCVFLWVCVLFTYMCVLHYVLIIFLRHSHSQFRSTVFVKIIFLYSHYSSQFLSLSRSLF